MASVPAPEQPLDLPVPTPVDLPVPTPIDPPVPAPTDIEYGGPKGLEPTRYGDWEKSGIAVDF